MLGKMQYTKRERESYSGLSSKKHVTAHFRASLVEETNHVSKEAASCIGSSVLSSYRFLSFRLQ